MPLFWGTCNWCWDPEDQPFQGSLALSRTQTHEARSVAGRGEFSPAETTAGERGRARRSAWNGLTALQDFFLFFWVLSLFR